jgi:predicted dinucleotide-binding enzyme
MKATIVDAGSMRRGIAIRTAAGRHEVEILDHDPARAEKLANGLGGSASAPAPDASFGGEVVLLALYFPDIKDAAREYADRLGARSSSTPPILSTRRPGTGWPRRRARRSSKPSTRPSPAR